METSKNRLSANNNNQIVVKTPIIPSFILESQFPIDLWLPRGVSIVSVNSTSDENQVMSKLSETCRYFYGLYQPELKERAAKKLLECFFMPTETNVKKVIAMLWANPKLAFVKIKNDKSITDIRQRGFEGSLLQAAMQTKAVGWLNWLNKEVIEKTHTQAEAHAQYQEKFGQPDERKARMLAQLDIDLKAIEAAFTQDPCTKFTQDPCTNGIPTLQATLDAFEMTRQHVAEENKAGQVIKTGEFFPLEIMQKIYEVYCKHWDDNNWRANHLNCYSKFMIGFAPRFFVADDLLRLLNGLSHETDNQVPLFGDFKRNITFNNRQYELDFLQPDKYSDFRLGMDFFVDVYFGWLAADRWLAADGWPAADPTPSRPSVPAFSGRSVRLWKNCVEQKHQTCRTYAHHPRRSGCTIV